MSIRKNTNPRPLDLPPEMQDLLLRNGMRGYLAGSSEGFALIVQGHDSPLLTYPVSEKQLRALTDWGTNSANKRCYNTFASIVAADFDLPKDFVHARNANGRVAMGLHGYRTGAGEYGRVGMPMRPFHPICHGFLGWTPRQQGGFHLRRIGGDLYYPGAPIVPNRPDGRMKPGELQSGGYGFYYKGHATAPVAERDVLKELQSVVTPIHPRQRSTESAKPYKELVASPVYFTNERWQECLASHGIIVDSETRTLTVQSAAVDADLQYDLTEEELAALTANTLEEATAEKRLEIINGVIQDDYDGKVTLEMLNGRETVNLSLHPEVLEDLNSRLAVGQQQAERIAGGMPVEAERELREGLPRGGVAMNGNDLAAIRPDKGWYREGKHGREVTVDDIRVEPSGQEGTYKMTAIIDGERVSHEITQKQYDKFMAIDDYHRLKLFSKVFGEVDMKSRDRTPLGTKIGAALLAGAAVAAELGHDHHCHSRPVIFAEHHHHGPAPRPYFKPGVDTPMDVATRNFEAAANEHIRHEMRHGM